MSATFRVRVTKDNLVFSAAHFITIGSNYCERLHGHNWRVAVEVTGPLDENQYVFDFIALRDAALQLVAELDHRMLLPDRHPQLTLHRSPGEIEVRYSNRRWVFPEEECVVLPIQQTTTELIAQWFAQRLFALTKAAGADHLETLAVEVEENFGQWAGYTLYPHQLLRE